MEDRIVTPKLSIMNITSDLGGVTPAHFGACNLVSKVKGTNVIYCNTYNSASLYWKLFHNYEFNKRPILVLDSDTYTKKSMSGDLSVEASEVNSLVCYSNRYTHVYSGNNSVVICYGCTPKINDVTQMIFSYIDDVPEDKEDINKSINWHLNNGKDLLDAINKINNNMSEVLLLI
jgi:hypothetical protein